MFQKLYRLCHAIWLFAAVASASPSSAQTYAITDLGALPNGAGSTGANAVNSKGNATGSSGSFEFLSAGGAIANLGLAGFVVDPISSQGFGINTANQVVGETFDGVQNATLWTAGVYTELVTGSTVDGSVAEGINTSGQVVGTMSILTNTLTNHAFVWSPTKANGTTGKLTDLNPMTPANSQSAAYAINDSSMIAGELNGIAAVFSGGKWISLGALAAGGSSTAVAINTSGQVVGSSSVSTSVGIHAFLFSGGRMTDLGVLPNFVASKALAINDSGQVVGNSTPAGRRVTTTAVLFTPSGPVDLNTRIPANSGWFLVSANGINAAGQIVGTGGFSGQGNHAFLLTPVP